MEHLDSLTPDWLLWMIGVWLVVWKWRWIVRPLLWLYRLKVPTPYEVAYSHRAAASAEFREYQSRDMSFEGRPLVHFFTVELMTNASPITIQKVWVTTLRCKEYEAWTLGDMWLQPDVNVRLDSQFIHAFRIQAHYDDEPDAIVCIKIKNNGKVKAVWLISPLQRLINRINRI